MAGVWGLPVQIPLKKWGNQQTVASKIQCLCGLEVFEYTLRIRRHTLEVDKKLYINEPILTTYIHNNNFTVIIKHDQNF